MYRSSSDGSIDGFANLQPRSEHPVRCSHAKCHEIDESIKDLESDDDDEYFRNVERLVFKAANRLFTFWKLFY